MHGMGTSTSVVLAFVAGEPGDARLPGALARAAMVIVTVDVPIEEE